MMKLLKGSGLLVLSLLLGATTALAAKDAAGVLRVEDKAKLFSAEGIKKAEVKFHDVTFKAKTHWTVVTISDVPESKKADLQAVGSDKNKAIRFFGELATSLAKERNEVGVFTLVYNNGDKLIVKTVSDKASDLHRHFNDTDAATLSDKLLDGLRAAKKKSGDEAVSERDGGLMAGTSFVIDQLKDTSLPEAKKTTGTIAKANNDVKASTGMSIWSWVCIGLVAALSIWVVIALVRALTNRGGGGGGGGYGGGGYGGGGGGMGFFGTFMTGMLGAAAGMWMYNSFFGGNHYGNDMSAGGGDNYGGDNGGSADTGEGNFDGGAEGGGGDWGDSGGDAGGGDAGGGGDWGGDTGGGGDWGGGGGGDAGGGGGGGDW